MIVMHGQGDSLDAFSSFDEELDIPWMNYLLVNAPDSYEDGFSWYELEPKHAPGVRRSRKLLSRLLAQLALEGWQSEDIFLLGHSQGALMACDILLNSKKPFAGVVGVSGYVWFFQGWKKLALSGAAANTPWLMTYGLRDKIIPAQETREDLETLWEAGLSVTARAFNKGHDFNLSQEVPFIKSWIEFLVGKDVPYERVTSPWTSRENLPLVSAPRRRSKTRLRL